MLYNQPPGRAAIPTRLSAAVFCHTGYRPALFPKSFGQISPASYRGLTAALTIATIFPRIVLGSVGHAATTAAKSGSFAAARSAPYSALCRHAACVFPDDCAVCSIPVGGHLNIGRKGPFRRLAT